MLILMLFLMTYLLLDTKQKKNRTSTNNVEKTPKLIFINKEKDFSLKRNND